MYLTTAVDWTSAVVKNAWCLHVWIMDNGATADLLPPPCSGPVRVPEIHSPELGILSPGN